jgi:tryptophanyl-tRNA synthetase
MRFNASHGELLKIPEPFIPATGARIRSLLDPLRKMDKSDKNPRSFISMLDPPEEVLSKIQKAKTDSVGSFSIHEETEGITNLVTIFRSIG